MRPRCCANCASQRPMTRQPPTPRARTPLRRSRVKNRPLPMQRTTPLLWMHRIPAQRPKALIRDPPRDPPDVLDVDGKIDQTHGLGNEMFYLTATGRGGTPTAGWQYDYHGRPGENWALRDRGRVDRHPTLVGTVIRVKPHGESRAGEVLSFIAVKPPQATEVSTFDLGFMDLS